MAEYEKPLYTDNPDIIAALLDLFNQINGQFIDEDENNENLENLRSELSNFLLRQLSSVQTYMRIDTSDPENIGIIEGDYSDDTQTDPFNLYTDEEPTSEEGEAGDYAIIFYTEPRTFSLLQKNDTEWQEVASVTLNVANFFIITDKSDTATAKIFMGEGWKSMTWEPDLSNYYSKAETNELLIKKQATLVGEPSEEQNIKTINGENILGSGDIEVGGNIGGISNFYGVIFGTAEDVTEGNATEEFTAGNFQAALNNDTITKIGFYGGGGERTYIFNSMLTGTFTKYKLITATNGQVTLAPYGNLYSTSARGLGYHLYMQITISGGIGGNGAIEEQINEINLDAIAHKSDIRTPYITYDGGSDLTDYFNNEFMNIFKLGGTLILPAGNYTLGDITGDASNLQNTDIDKNKWVPSNIEIVCRTGTATIKGTGNTDRAILAFGNNCIIRNIKFTMDGTTSITALLAIYSGNTIQACTFEGSAYWLNELKGIRILDGGSNNIIDTASITLTGGELSELHGIANAYGGGETTSGLILKNVSISVSAVGNSKDTIAARGLYLTNVSNVTATGLKIIAHSGIGVTQGIMINIGHNISLNITKLEVETTNSTLEGIILSSVTSSSFTFSSSANFPYTLTSNGTDFLTSAITALFFIQYSKYISINFTASKLEYSKNGGAGSLRRQSILAVAYSDNIDITGTTNTINIYGPGWKALLSAYRVNNLTCKPANTIALFEGANSGNTINTAGPNGSEEAKYLTLSVIDINEEVLNTYAWVNDTEATEGHNSIYSLLSYINGTLSEN